MSMYLNSLGVLVNSGPVSTDNFIVAENGPDVFRTYELDIKGDAIPLAADWISAKNAHIVLNPNAIVTRVVAFMTGVSTGAGSYLVQSVNPETGVATTLATIVATVATVVSVTPNLVTPAESILRVVKTGTPDGASVGRLYIEACV